MRAREFITELKRVPTMTLRHINKLKKNQEARHASFARRDALLPVMYGNPARELERIELEKAYIDLAQQQAELVATRAELDRAGNEKLAQMAASGMKTRRDNQKKINDNAMRGLGRRKRS